MISINILVATSVLVVECIANATSCPPLLKPNADTLKKLVVMGGRDATGSEFLAKSTVKLKNKNGLICTAVIITSKFALTGAHCVEVQSKTTADQFAMEPIDTMKLAFDGQDGFEQSRPVEAFVAAPQYAQQRMNFRNSASMTHGDIAVMMFSGGLPEGYLSFKKASDAVDLADGGQVVIAGYGGANNEHNEFYRSIGRLRYNVADLFPGYINKIGQLTVIHSPGKGTCRGDSGGPVFHKSQNGNWALAGLISGGGDQFDIQRRVTYLSNPNQMPNCNQYTAVTPIAPYVEWIKATVRKMEDGENLGPYSRRRAEK